MGLEIGYHGSTGRASQTLELDLINGGSTTIADDTTLQTVHGAIMWLAWAILASYGIMSSSARFLYGDGPKWFFIHRLVQSLVVILTITGFILAIYFMQKNESPHFSQLHHMIGLIVTILCILQPINALFRAHPPSDGWPNSQKPLKRVVWEYVHKISGYTAWILGGAVAPTLGLILLDQETLGYLNLVWCGLLLFVYIGLRFMAYSRRKGMKQIDQINKTENSLQPNVEDNVEEGGAEST